MLCPNATGADIRSACIKAEMFTIRKPRQPVNEKDLLYAVQKVVKGYPHVFGHYRIVHLETVPVPSA